MVFDFSTAITSDGDCYCAIDNITNKNQKVSEFTTHAIVSLIVEIPAGLFLLFYS